MPRPVRNDRLRDLVTAAGWSFDNLARAVNSAGAEAGLRLCYDRSAVAHWLSGSRPRGQVPALIAEVLTRRLGRLVTTAELGLDLVTRREKAGPGGGITALAELVDADLDLVGHELLARSVYRMEVPVVPAWPAQARPVHRRGEHTGAASARIGMAQHLVGVFAAANHRYGGGHARTALTAYLAADVLPHLAGPTTGVVHREMLDAAVDLTLLIGFACFDSNEHGLAQRYYRVALDLAVLDHDPVRYAIVLRALSQQACHLGHGRPALGLALAALSAGERDAQSHTSAFLHAQVSLSYAALGHGDAALAAHGRARDSLTHAIGPAPIFGSYHRGELHYHAASLRTVDGDTQGAIAALGSALRHYPPAERRSRALTLAELAERQLDLGLCRRACTTAHRFLDDYPSLRSGRVTTAMHGLRQRLRQFQREPAARAFLRRCSMVPESRTTAIVRG